MAGSVKRWRAALLKGFASLGEGFASLGFDVPTPRAPRKPKTEAEIVRESWEAVQQDWLNVTRDFNKVVAGLAEEMDVWETELSKGWQCHICGRTRPDDKIAVAHRPVAGMEDLFEQGTRANVRYCIDKDVCREVATAEGAWLWRKA